jgi:hypothetical protein
MDTEEASMKTEDSTFTITTFWRDWLLQPVVLEAAWLTARWGLRDMQRAGSLGGWGGCPTGRRHSLCS